MVSQKNARKPYPTDLTDAQWSMVAGLMPTQKSGGRPREVAIREIVNAIIYAVKSGRDWRMLPHDFPQRDLVCHYFRAWQRDGTWKSMHDALRSKLRKKLGKKEQPTAGILDSQSVKTAEKRGVRGYDAGKKVNGRKRHILVDTLGLILEVVVHAADIQDRDGAKLVLKRIKKHFLKLKLIWADGGYAGKLVWRAKRYCGWRITIIKRSDGHKGFEVLPKRWIVERTFSWLYKYRRLRTDYEYRADTGEALIHVAMIHIMTRRLSKE
ncbi:IS5 family transposase [Patescibacteria group bacterium]|nr:MAG: IS5 family transposase [Patescibacteria group bacterium]